MTRPPQMKFFCAAAVVVLLCVSAVACKGKPTPVPAHEPTHGAASSPLTSLDGFEGEIGLTVKGTFGGVPAPATATNVIALVQRGREGEVAQLPAEVGVGVVQFFQDDIGPSAHPTAQPVPRPRSTVPWRPASGLPSSGI